MDIGHIQYNIDIRLFVQLLMKWFVWSGFQGGGVPWAHRYQSEAASAPVSTASAISASRSAPCAQTDDSAVLGGTPHLNINHLSLATTFFIGNHMILNHVYCHDKSSVVVSIITKFWGKIKQQYKGFQFGNPKWSKTYFLPYFRDNSPVFFRFKKVPSYLKMYNRRDCFITS